MITQTLPARLRTEVEAPSIALVKDDVYAVLGADGMHGFVEKVGNVYVALCGPDLPRACEVGQSLSWDVAVSMVEYAMARSADGR
ncbi:MAG TPA: hypothetical protein VN200_03550 [Rhodoglobus sp.]|nr:hypothetical protein [Rhodoglobus sp.]